jgi:outer membrane lipase/esterase
MFTNGSAYGFSHTSFADPCYTGNLDGTGGTVCADPDNYLVWDFQGHLTAAASAVIGRAMAAAVVPAPGTLALLGLGLIGIRVLRRKAAPAPAQSPHFPTN